MAKNRYLEDAKQWTLPVIAGVVSGGPVIVGMIPGVALTNRAADGTATVQTDGAFTLSVVAAGAVTVGQPIYITSATGVLTDAAGAGKQLFGHALLAKGSGTSSIPIRIAQFAVAVDTPA